MNRARQVAAIAMYAFVGGFADATSLLKANLFTGHVTGNIILLVISLVAADWRAALLRLLAIACFLTATSLGMRWALRPHPRSLLFAAQCCLLVPLALWNPLTRTDVGWSVALFCLSLGLQNGMVTRALGVSVHSTFLSGDLTTLLKASTPANGEQPSRPGAPTDAVLVWLLGGFCVGAATGAALTRSTMRTDVLYLLLAAFLASRLQAEG